RWDKLIDAEPSRFIEEIHEHYLDFLVPKDDYKYQPLINTDIFDETDKSKLRQTKPKQGTPPPAHKPTETQLRKLRRLRPKDRKSTTKATVPNLSLKQGQTVEHRRFGKGVVVNVEGVGQNKKAEIDFNQGGLKKLLLRFAKLEVLDR